MLIDRSDLIIVNRYLRGLYPDGKIRWIGNSVKVIRGGEVVLNRDGRKLLVEYIESLPNEPPSASVGRTGRQE